jgi:pimeloyl-ACP methyl ester carboxylesterase
MLCKAINFVLIMLCLCSPAFSQNEKISRRDFYVTSDTNIRIFVREVQLSVKEIKPPVLLLHGARVPGIASFDLLVANGSLAVDLAAAGHKVYIMDARGYGFSTRPEMMSQPPEANPPLVRSAEVVHDIAAVVDAIRQHNKVERVALLGWATGGHWLGYYASLYSKNVSHLIIHNSLYGGTPTHPSLGRGSSLEDPQHPGQFNVAGFGAYRFNSFESFLSIWDKNIPLADKSAWRDPAIVSALQTAVIDSDATAKQRQPATFRAPTGAMEDSFYLAIGRQLWDASLIKAPTLIIRSENDFWSRPEDVKKLTEHLIHAARVKSVIIPNGTHFVHLDRAERGRALFLQEIIDFLSKD